MPDLSLFYGVTRTELGLAELALEDPVNGYSIVRMGPGAASWRRETVTSPYCHGDTLVAAVRDAQIAPLTVRVRADTPTTLDTRLATLLEAFSQYEYYTGIITDGAVSKQWRCSPADWSVGESGEMNKFHLMSNIYEVTFSIPRQPIQIAGSI